MGKICTHITFKYVNCGAKNHATAARPKAQIKAINLKQLSLELYLLENNRFKSPRSKILEIYIDKN